MNHQLKAEQQRFSFPPLLHGYTFPIHCSSSKLQRHEKGAYKGQVLLCNQKSIQMQE